MLYLYELAALKLLVIFGDVNTHHPEINDPSRNSNARNPTGDHIARALSKNPSPALTQQHQYTYNGSRITFRHILPAVTQTC